MSRNGAIALLFHGLFVGFVMAPLVIVVVVSFTPEGFLSLPTRGLSLRWFYAIFDDRQFVDAFCTSLLLGGLAATGAVMLAIPAALAIARFDFPGRQALIAFFLSPLIIPHVVLGVAFLRFFSQAGMLGTFSGLAASHIVVIFPYALRLVLASLTARDPATERAAISLGASGWTVFRRVILPLMIPGIAGGWMISFIQSFDEVTMTVFVASPGTMTLPVRMFHYIAESIDPLIASISTVVMGITFLMMLVVDRIYGLDRILVGRG